MSDFVLLFRTTADSRQQAMGTPEAAQRSMQSWLKWLRELESNGHLKDPGQPLDTGGAVVRGQAKLVTDGPYIETKDMVLGFIVVQARDLAQAVELSKDCPMLQGDSSVEVRPVGQRPA